MLYAEMWNMTRHVLKLPDHEANVPERKLQVWRALDDDNSGFITAGEFGRFMPRRRPLRVASQMPGANQSEECAAAWRCPTHARRTAAPQKPCQAEQGDGREIPGRGGAARGAARGAALDWQLDRPAVDPLARQAVAGQQADDAIGFLPRVEFITNCTTFFLKWGNCTIRQVPPARAFPLGVLALSLHRPHLLNGQDGTVVANDDGLASGTTVPWQAVLDSANGLPPRSEEQASIQWTHSHSPGPRRRIG